MTDKFKICLVMRGSNQWIGGIEYTKNIIRALGALPYQDRRQIELSVIVNKKVDSIYYKDVIPYVDQVFDYEDLKSKLHPHPGYRFLNKIKRNKQPLNIQEQFFQKGLFDFIYPHSPISLGVNYSSAAWIPDFQHKYLPEFFSKDLIRVRDQKFADAARNAKYVVLSSQMAKNDFERLYPKFSYKARVFYFRTFLNPEWLKEKPEDIQRKYNLPDRFFLICNQFWQHKNHKMLFEALRYLKDKEIRPIIVCTGHVYDHRAPEYVDEIFQLIHTSGLSGQIYILGLIPKNDQIQLMRRSIAVVQPSLFEGWNTIVEESRVLGKPIIMSDIPVHKEQSPAGGVFFEKNSIESLSIKIEEFWKKLAEGPDRENEIKSWKKSEIALEDMGQRFLIIAKGQPSDYA